MTPRVLFLDHTAALGGAELYLLDAVRPFRATGSVVLFSDGPLVSRLEAQNMSVEVLPAPAVMLAVTKQGGRLHGMRSLPGVLHLVARVARVARSHDVLFANSQKALVIAALAGWLARRPVIWNLHDLLTPAHFSPANRRLVVLLANTLTARVLVNSEATRTAFVQAGGEVRKTHVVYNGLDVHSFDTIPEATVQTLRHQLGLSEVPVVGVFSRLAPWKGQHVLLDALTRLPDVHALLVGDALFAPDQAYRQELERMVAQHDLSGRVHFLGFRHDVPTLMRLVDVVVHTSTSPEPFGRVIAEGMLAKKPVVATRAGGALEIVTQETGHLVPPDDAEALARVLRMLLQHPEDARQMGARGYEAVKARFSIPTMHEALHRHIAAVARGTTRSRPRLRRDVSSEHSSAFLQRPATRQTAP